MSANGAWKIHGVLERQQYSGSREEIFIESQNKLYFNSKYISIIIIIVIFYHIRSEINFAQEKLTNYI